MEFLKAPMPRGDVIASNQQNNGGAKRLRQPTDVVCKRSRMFHAPRKHKRRPTPTHGANRIGCNQMIPLIVRTDVVNELVPVRPPI
jgi:hypothetical protein